MRRFNLNRRDDITGVSGVGVVAEGVQFSDGIVILRWFGEIPSTVIHESIQNVIKIHGHNGSTLVEWLDSDY